MKFRGLHHHRLRDNPEEKRFADAWDDSNTVGQTLAWLLHVGDQRGRPPDPSVHDIITSSTVIQWLGSPVGQTFLAQLGYVKDVKEKPKGKK